MLKALVRKQFMEMFRGYFVNRKTGKARSKKAVIGSFLLFGMLMLFLCAMFFFLSMALAYPLHSAGLDWLYFAVMGILAVLLGVFGSVFNTYAGLYTARDNELLISMPIPPSKILFSRVIGVIAMSMLYGVSVWLPAAAAYWVFVGAGAAAVVYQVLLSFVITLFVSVLTCALGWVVALIASRLKNKSLITVFVSIVFFVVYYSFCFRMEDILKNIVAYSVNISEMVRKWLGLFYILGKAATGDTVSLLIITGITLALCAVCMLVMSRSFISIATRKTSAGKPKYVARAMKQTGVGKALLSRELKRFIASPSYVMNCGIGIIMLLLAVAAFLIKRDAIDMGLVMIARELPFIANAIPVLIVGLVCVILGMDMISTPSISLEGKNLWILKSLPVSAYEIMKAKVNLHVMLNVWPGLLAVLVLGLSLKTDTPVMILMLVYVWMFIWFSAELGFIIGLKRPNLHWTSEMVVIKQSLNMLIVMLLNFVLAAGFPALYFLLRDSLSIELFLGATALLLAVGAAIMRFYLKGRGTKVFEAL